MEVVSVDFPLVVEQFGVCLDLELAKNYALPIVNFQQEQLVNLVDELVASFAGAQVCLEVVGVADPNAAMGVQKFIYKKTSHDPWIGKTLLDQGTDFLGQAIGINQKDPQTQKNLHKLKLILGHVNVHEMLNINSTTTYSPAKSKSTATL